MRRLASALMAQWCVGSKAEAAGGVFQVREDEPAPRRNGQTGAGLIPKGVSNLATIPCVIGLGVSVSCFPRQSAHRPCGSRLRHMLLIWDNFESACSLPDPNGAHPAA